MLNWEQVPNDKLGSEVRFAEAGWNIIFVGLPRRFRRLQIREEDYQSFCNGDTYHRLQCPMTSSR